MLAAALVGLCAAYGSRHLALTLAIALLWGCGNARPWETERPPDILYLLIDTLRPDHLGAYGYERPTSPNLDRLAREGVLFERVSSVAPWTNPTIAALFSGRHPQAVLAPARHRDAIKQPLPEELDTLAEVLKRAGYRTAGLVDHPGINPNLRYSQGFDHWEALYREAGVRSWGVTDSGFVLGRVERVLDEPGEGPLFLYLHLVYPHRPYTPPAPYDTLFGPGFTKEEKSQRERIVNRYDGEIRYTDDFFGWLYALLEERGWLERGVILVTSDHGEGFWEHGLFEHGNSFYEEVLRVPLLLRLPGGFAAGTRIGTRVSNIDLYPTVLDLAGVPEPEGLDGRSLLRFVTPGGEPPPEEGVFSESPHSGNIHAASVVEGDYKYILRRPARDGAEARELLFRLADDPAERRDRHAAESEAQRLDHLRAQLQRHQARSRVRRAGLPTERREVDPETAERLRALGYVD